MGSELSSGWIGHVSWDTDSVTEIGQRFLKIAPGLLVCLLCLQRGRLSVAVEQGVCQLTKSNDRVGRKLAKDDRFKLVSMTKLRWILLRNRDAAHYHSQKGVHVLHVFQCWHRVWVS